MLRDYHGALGALVVEHGGTLEHFAGDGVLVFFNDPIPQDDHPERAVRLAIAMRERFAELAEGWHKLGYELASGSASRRATRPWGGSDSRAATTTRRSATRSSSPRDSAPKRRPGRSSSASGRMAAVDGSVATEPVGELTLKGISRPVLAFDVIRTR